MEAFEVQIFGQYQQRMPGLFNEYKQFIHMSSLHKDIYIQVNHRSILKRILINASDDKQYSIFSFHNFIH